MQFGFSGLADVGVDVLGGGGIGVTQKVLGVFDGYVVFVEHGGVSVTNLVWGAGDTGFFGVSGPELLELHFSEDAAGLIGKDLAAAGLELFQQLVHEGDGTMTSGGLGSLDHGKIAVVVDRFGDVDGSGLQIDVLPGESQEFPPGGSRCRESNRRTCRRCSRCWF